MELDAFRSRLGIDQGRIAPAGAAPASGMYVFVLGNDAPGYFCNLDPGDHAEIVQDVDLTTIDLVRVHLQMRIPEDLPAGVAWEASIRIDGVKQARASCRPGRTRRITDLAANVSKLTGVHPVAIRLELVSV
jgi:hypothetical protein